nr:MAG TPA: hypothetical protein [Caudoviricetes sp.]
MKTNFSSLMTSSVLIFVLTNLISVQFKKSLNTSFIRLR